MDRPPVTASSVEKFRGQHSDADPADLLPGTLYRQLNLLSVVDGELRVRGGLKPVATDELE